MTGLLLVWTNIPEDLESGCNEWYNRERKTDRILDAVLMIEAVSVEDLNAAMSSLDWDGIRARGGAPDAPAARFRVVYTLRSQAETATRQ